MKIRIKKFNGSEQVYFLALSIYVFAYIILNRSQFGYMLPETLAVLMYLTIDALLFLKIAMYLRKAATNGQFKIIGIIVLIIITGVITGDHNYVSTLLLISASNDIAFDDVMKVLCVEILVLSLIVFLSYRIGIVGETIVYRGTMARHSLGFKYVGALDSFYRHISILMMYLLRKRKPVLLTVLLMIGSFIIYRLSGTRTNLYLSLAFCLLYLLLVIRGKKTNDIKNKILFYVKLVFACVYFPIMAIVSCILPQYVYKSTFLLALNSLLTNRLAIANTALETYDFKITGQSIQWIGSQAVATGRFTADSYNFVDNAYIQVGLQYGILMLVIICLAYSALFCQMVKENNKFMCIWLLLIGIECFSSPSLFEITTNSIIIYAFSVFISIRKNRKYINSQ